MARLTEQFGQKRFEIMNSIAAAPPPLPAVSDEASRDNAKLRQILDGARKVFLADGFDGASMNDIARAAGVSKGTLYVYFDSKEALFEGLVRNEKQTQAERVCPFDMGGDASVETTLRTLGRGLLEMLTRPDNVALLRMVIGVAGKLPAIGRAFYEAGPQYGRERLAAYLERQATAGRLQIDDASVAAANFMHLAHSEIAKAQMFGVVESVSPEQIEKSVDNAVAVFMRAYGVKA